MSRMLELVRTSQLASHQMMTASKGALRLPEVEMVEILVYIAEHNKIYGETARMTLAGLAEASAKQIASDPNTPREVLDYWASPKNIRPALFPILLENPAVSLTKIAELATILKNEMVDVLIASPRVRNSSQVLHDLSTNHNLSGTQAARVRALIGGEVVPVAIPDERPPDLNKSDLPTAEIAQTHAPELVEAAGAKVVPVQPCIPDQAPATHEHSAASQGDDPEAESALVAYFAEHAKEIAAQPEKPFHAIGGLHEEFAHEAEATVAPVQALAAAASAATVPPVAPEAQPTVQPPTTPKPLVNPENEKRGSVLRKINKLDIKGRIQLAMKGTKEERGILVRDGTKIVALAVLDSPKISDGEVEKFATQKNVLEAVLRAIPMRRRFAKNYAIIRNLVFNPRTPLDVGLGLMKNLLVADLKNLSGNKEVAETVRKLALRMFKQKVEAANKS